MASESPPPNSVDNNTPDPASAPAQATVNEPQATPEPPKDVSPSSVFVNNQPLREDQVQNAVKFLSHPRVKGSPIVHRRNFLERKGLTKEEIDEAFRRVPDPPTATTSGQSNTYQDAQATPATNIQAQAPMQPATAVQSGVISTMARRFHWSYALFAVGFLTISGAGMAIVFKRSVIPRLKSWVRRVVLDEEDSLDGEDSLDEETGKPSLAEEATAAAKAAAAAAADVAKVSQEMLVTKNEEKKCFSEFMTLLNVQLQEIKTLRNSITKLEGQSYVAGKNNVREEYLDGSITRSVQPVDKPEYDMRSVRPVSPPASSAEPPHPKSYMEIMSMVQRGERPPNIRDIDDRPPNPNQPISNPSLAPRTKPWEAGQPAISSSFAPQSQVTAGGASYSAQDNGVTYQFNNDNSVPWRQQTNARITEVVNGSNGSVNVTPTQRRWVPPQPPPVAMAEAAVAIRQPKSIPKDVNPKAEEAATPVNEFDELQRITQMSESGGPAEPSVGGSTVTTSSEFGEEQITEV